MSSGTVWAVEKLDLEKWFGLPELVWVAQIQVSVVWALSGCYLGCLAGGRARVVKRSCEGL